MLNQSKLNIAKQKISDLNKKYSRKIVFEDSSSEKSIHLFEKEDLVEFKDPSSHNSSSGNSVAIVEIVPPDKQISNQQHRALLSRTKNFSTKSKFSKEVNSTESSIASNKSKIIKKWPEQQAEFLVSETKLNVDRETIPEIRNITPTGVSKRLANVFIISSSDEEELSEDITLGQIIDRAKSYTSTSARTVSEDLISENGNKKTTPRSIKFVRIDTPIITVKEEDENNETSSMINNEQNLHDFNATNEVCLSSESTENKEIYSTDKTIDSKSNSNSISSSFKLSNSDEPKEEIIIDSSQRTNYKANKTVLAPTLINISTIDNLIHLNDKPKKVLCKSKGIQTELSLRPLFYNNKKHTQKSDRKINNNIKINVQNRPTLKTSTLYRFTDMSDAEINKVSKKVSNIYIEDFLEGKSCLL